MVADVRLTWCVDEWLSADLLRLGHQPEDGVAHAAVSMLGPGGEGDRILSFDFEHASIVAASADTATKTDRKLSRTRWLMPSHGSARRPYLGAPPWTVERCGVVEARRWWASRPG